MMARSRVLLACLSLLLFFSPSEGASPRFLTATVARVADGDTITVFTDNQTSLRIRLLGIDAPEVAHNGKPGQPFGDEARRWLGDRLKGPVVQVQAYGRDQHHRVLAVIVVDGVNMNQELVRQGFAEIYRGGMCQAYCRELEQAEREARQARQGMWSQATYESPRTFRQRMRLSKE